MSTQEGRREGRREGIHGWPSGKVEGKAEGRREGRRESIQWPYSSVSSFRSSPPSLHSVFRILASLSSHPRNFTKWITALSQDPQTVVSSMLYSSAISAECWGPSLEC